MRIAVTTTPFNYHLLNDMLPSHTIHYNKLGRKNTRKELAEYASLADPDIIIAGTERYDKSILDLMPNLKLIARVGIGYDGIDFRECRKRGIIVTYTPSAPSEAVADLTMMHMLNALRRFPQYRLNPTSTWNRHVGRELNQCKVGIIGYGRIGKLVYDRTKAFNVNPENLYVNDLNDIDILNYPKEDIFKMCDIVTLHVPFNELTENMVTTKELQTMKSNAILINTSRGGIVNEKDVADHLFKKPNFYYCCDTFVDEPYNGELTAFHNAYLSPHLGSCTETSRDNMEAGAIEEAVLFIDKKTQKKRLI